MNMYTFELKNGMVAELGRSGPYWEGTLMVRENSEAKDYELFSIRDGEWDFVHTSEGVPDLSAAWEDADFVAWAKQSRLAIEKERAEK